MKQEISEEIQDLLKASVGLNLGVHFLTGSITFDALVNQPNAFLASKNVLHAVVKRTHNF